MNAESKIEYKKLKESYVTSHTSEGVESNVKSQTSNVANDKGIETADGKRLTADPKDLTGDLQRSDVKRQTSNVSSVGHETNSEPRITNDNSTITSDQRRETLVRRSQTQKQFGEGGSDINKSIKHWPKADRPREKLLRNGEHTLTNSELLAILLRTGTKGISAIDLSRRILEKFRTFRNMSHTDSRDWLEFKGLGLAKIAQLKAAIEIGRRFREDEAREERPQIKSSKDVVDILMPRMRDLKTEVFKVIYLNSQNRIIDVQDIAEGTVNHATPIIREIFQKALQNFSTSIICAHNHPSGINKPSVEDQKFTKQLIEAGKVVQVKVMDHVIIGNNAHYSFAEEDSLI